MSQNNNNDKSIVDHFTDFLGGSDKGSASSSSSSNSNQGMSSGNNDQDSGSSVGYSNSDNSGYTPKETKVKITPQTVATTAQIISKTASTADAIHPVLHDAITLIAGPQVAATISKHASTVLGPVFEKELPMIQAFHAAAKGLLGMSGMDGTATATAEVEPDNQMGSSDNRKVASNNNTNNNRNA